MIASGAIRTSGSGSTPKRTITSRVYRDVARYGYAKDMKSDATYAGDPRHHASEVIKLRERVKILIEENRRLRQEHDVDALSEFTAALRRRRLTAPRPGGLP